MLLFDLSTLAIVLPHIPRYREIEIPNPYEQMNNRRMALHRTNSGMRRGAMCGIECEWKRVEPIYTQLDMYDSDGEAYITHDRTLWWAGSVYANDWSADPRWLGVVMAIVKQDSPKQVHWDMEAMQHCPDALNLHDCWAKFTQWGHAVESVKPGWWEANVLEQEQQERLEEHEKASGGNIA